jgi:hypothetical protein
MDSLDASAGDVAGRGCAVACADVDRNCGSALAHLVKEAGKACLTSSQICLTGAISFWS